MIRRKLPPLNSLKVFEVAGRKRNFSEAAEELCITQSAVSKQVRILEQYLNIQLFSRDSGTVQITDAGEELLNKTAIALDLIESSAQLISQDIIQEKLTVNITPSLSSYWLLDNIGDFSSRYPKMALFLNSDQTELDWSRTGSDVAIRVLPIGHSQKNADLMLKEELVLVGSPTLLKQKAIKTVHDIANHSLIQNNSRPDMWDKFFNRLNMDTPDIQNTFGCEHTHMTMRAALNGLGLAIVPKLLCENFLNSKKLENPLDLQISLGYGYYFISPPYKRDLRKVYFFREWLLSILNKDKITKFF